MSAIEIIDSLILQHPELQAVKDHISSLEQQLLAFARVRTALKAAKPEAFSHWFVCGASEATDEGLPKYIEVCPQYGADIWVRYAKTNLSGGLEW